MDSSLSSPHYRHQSSLERVIDYSVAAPPLDANQRAQAKRRFYSIVNRFEGRPNARATPITTGNQYDRSKLIRFTYEYARSEKSQDIVLRAFFDAITLSIDGEDDVDFSDEERLGSLLFGFADHLLDHFFLPLRASTKQTPQISPVYHSAIQRAQGGGIQDFVGTPRRLSELRGSCLVRDRHRCVISRRFDGLQGQIRLGQDGDNAKDDDGNLLSLPNEPEFELLEVAHILPHSLTETDTNSELNASKKATLDILNMFDHGIIHLIEGEDIDRPRNAITLTHKLHYYFGDFKVFFQPVPDTEPHTYRIDTFLSPRVLPFLPVTRTLYLSENRTIDPPSQRFLALHCAIVHILHLSGAGDYIDELLRDMDEGIRVDGSTELGRLVTLRLGGWLDGRVCV